MFTNDPDTEFVFGVFYLSAMCGHGIIAGIAALWIWWYGVFGSQQTAEQNAQEAIEDGKTDDEARVGHGQPPVKRRRTTALAQDVDWTRGVDRPAESIAVKLTTLLRRQFETLAGAIGFRSRRFSSVNGLTCFICRHVFLFVHHKLSNLTMPNLPMC